MKINLENGQLLMSDDGFDVRGWVDIDIDGKHAEVNVIELLAAAQAFMIAKRESEDRDNL